MIRSFRDHGTKDIFDGRDTTRARRSLPRHLWSRAWIKLEQLNEARSLPELSTPSNRLEKLSGDRNGQHSVRINRQYRICFAWIDAEAWDVEITDYH